MESLDTDFGIAVFKGTSSNDIQPNMEVVVLNGELKNSVGIVKSVTGNAYRSDNKVVVQFEDDLCWFFPWDLKPVR